MFKIREAVLNDAEALMHLYGAHLTQTPPKEKQEIEQWSALLKTLIANENYHVLIGEADGKAVSSVTVIIIENLTHNLRPYALIENVVTHAAYRQRGYAAALMAEASALADAKGCYKIMLMTSSKKESTLRFYERCGFNRYDKTAFLKKL